MEKGKAGEGRGRKIGDQEDENKYSRKAQALSKAEEKAQGQLYYVFIFFLPFLLSSLNYYCMKLYSTNSFPIHHSNLGS